MDDPRIAYLLGQTMTHQAEQPNPAAPAVEYGKLIAQHLMNRAAAPFTAPLRAMRGEFDPSSQAGIGEAMGVAGQLMGAGTFAAPRGAAGTFGGKLYHGSPNTELGSIKANPPTRQFDNATSQFGAFFAPTEEAAKRYAGNSGRVYATQLDLKNPYEMPWGEFRDFQSPHKGPSGEDLPSEHWGSRADELKALAAKRREELQALGHDGVVVRNSKGDPIEVSSFNDVPVGITAYHGSPYDFDKFDIGKIGTGEGAQAYGHGLYFAENEGVAKGYRDTLSATRAPDAAHLDPDLGAKITASEQRMKDINNQIMEARFAGRAEQSINKLRIELDKATNDHLDLIEKTKFPGRMYQVSIKADPEHFLDWDKPLSEQSPKVKDVLRKRGINVDEYPGVSHPEDLRINEPEYAGQLREAGIPGIKYLDQGSRLKPFAAERIAQINRALKESPSTGTPADEARIAGLHAERKQLSSPETRNYVVFDDKLIDILKKYGLAGLAIPGGAYLSQSQPSNAAPGALADRLMRQ